MKIAFFGTWEFSKNILSDLINKAEVCLAVSQPDKPVWRKQVLIPTSVHAFATESNIQILQPQKLKTDEDFHQKLQELDLDFIVVVAYGKIIPKSILDIPKYGCINIHGSILPEYRWASPIQEAIKNGDTQTGVTIMYMSEWMDEGDILSIQTVDIWPDDTSLDIFEKFSNLWTELLIKTLQWIIDGEVEWIPQDGTKATYCWKIEKQDGEVDFNKMTWQEIYNRYRAYTPWPGIYGFYNDKKINFEKCRFEKTHHTSTEIGKVSHVSKKEIGINCGDGILILEQVKLEWKKSMDILSFINGNKDFLDYNF